MSVKGRSKEPHLELANPVHSHERSHERSHILHNQSGSLEGMAQHAFLQASHSSRSGFNIDDEEHNLELELHRFLSQHTIGSGGGNNGSGNLSNLGSITGTTPEVSNTIIEHRDEMAEAIEKAMAEIACPELWNQDHSNTEHSAGSEVHLDQLTMDGILGNDEPFVTINHTMNETHAAGVDDKHHHPTPTSLVPGIGPKPIIQQSMNMNARLGTDTPRSIDISMEGHNTHTISTPNDKRKQSSDAPLQAAPKKVKLFYDTLSPESLSPLSDNSDLLKTTDSKGSRTRHVQLNSEARGSAATSKDGGSKCNNSLTVTTPRIDINTVTPKTKPLPSLSVSPSSHVSPGKLTDEFTMQQVTETKKRIINTHKLILNFNFLKDSYTRSCTELKRTMFKLKESESHRAGLVKENEQLKRLVLELSERLESSNET
ncbi:Atc1p Ecym_4180 [Eremothecium cymbalariae DBVPG|uniref:Protein ATC1/LIC4 n=1 Tax=Eremothecium cymbalariae (strain CBS 270.75 / DBVPG 7215 / KCTC 17166 / NRRL Y-17582) TaxID=931890 RepID=G8JTA3_ERECY|nr:hypothetical protein Ecym_4180 [Eremothecium cymbalariae DBVPG\